MILLLQAAPPANPVSVALNSADWIFPACEIFHIVGFAVSIGTIALMDLSLLGIEFKPRGTPMLLKATALWTLLGLVVVLTAGLFLFLTDPIHYVYNPAFRFKMISLFIAIIYNYTIHRKVASSDILVQPTSRLVAVASLALWLCVVASGLFIAFVPEPGGY